MSRKAVGAAVGAIALLLLVGFVAMVGAFMAPGGDSTLDAGPPCVNQSPAQGGSLDGAATAAAAAFAAGWRGADLVQAVEVAGAESGYKHDNVNPRTVHGSNAKGLWQTMMPMHADMFAGASPFDPYANAKVAYALWKAGGWAPWVSSQPHWADHAAEAQAAVDKLQINSTIPVAQNAPAKDIPVQVDGKQVSSIAAQQLALAERLGHINLTVMQGGYGGSHILASGTSHNYPGVMDVSPGTVQVETLLRQVGFAAWARNIPGRESVGSGAHVHSVSLLDPGDLMSPQVYGSWAHHGNGLGGTNNDPAQHVAWIPNLASLVKGAPLVAPAPVTCAQPVAATSASTPGGAYRVATLNVQGASHRGNSAGRMRKAVWLLSHHRVSLVGLQEMQTTQAHSFDSLTSGVWQRFSSVHNTENSIAWRTDTFTLVRSGTLSVPYFYGRPKPMSYVLLRHGSSQVWVLDVHNASSSTSRGNQDRWRYAAVRLEQALILKLRDTGIPILWVGDMNAHGERGRQTAATTAIGLQPAGSRFNDDWISGRGLRFTGVVSDRGAVDRAATDHPIVVAGVG